jgi:ABC-type multidrug transport system ATPase subunit
LYGTRWAQITFLGARIASAGIHPPTHGAAFIFGLDVSVDIADLQRIMGVCAQDDLLWLELSARQHLRIYARLKAIRPGQIEGECDRVLNDVNLMGDADNAARTYSGGMKRRLSVGIASIGNPRIIFLDEPTTGMDPLSKRRVWAREKHIGGSGAHLNPWASSYAPPYRLYGVF